MNMHQAPDSAVRDRTRSAILSAAASTWARNRGASLAEVAERAGVGRSTVHRYFANREQLLNATIQDSADEIDRVLAAADLKHGTTLDAMRRLVSALVEAGDRIVFLFGDADTIQRLEQLAPDHDVDDPVIQLIRRGQDEGIFDSAVSPFWIQHVLWSLIYTGMEKAEDGTILRYDVVPTIIRTLEGGILARESS